MTVNDANMRAEQLNAAGAPCGDDCGRELAPGVTWRCAEHRRQPSPVTVAAKSKKGQSKGKPRHVPE